LKKLAEIAPLVEPVEDPRQAHWLVRPGGEQVYLVPACGRPGPDAGADPLFGPYPAGGGEMSLRLKASLERIARAENLKRLAAATQEASGDLGIKVQVELRLGRDRFDRAGSFPVAWPDTHLRFYDGDYVVLTLRNTGRVTADVSILLIDSGYGVSCLFPRQGMLNRIHAGDILRLPPVKQTAEKTSGLEHLAVVAVKGEGQAVDFACLEQPTLARARSLAGGSRALDSPLGKLFQNALFAEGRARGMQMDDLDNHSLSLLSWRIVPERRPAGPK
jgi:hypothetical protein